MVDAAEWPQEIDRERAFEAQQKAKESLGEDMLRFEADSARKRLRRAEYRLKAWELRKTV